MVLEIESGRPLPSPLCWEVADLLGSAAPARGWREPAESRVHPYWRTDVVRAVGPGSEPRALPPCPTEPIVTEWEDNLGFSLDDGSRERRAKALELLPRGLGPRIETPEKDSVQAPSTRSSGSRKARPDFATKRGSFESQPIPHLKLCWLAVGICILVYSYRTYQYGPTAR